MRIQVFSNYGGEPTGFRRIQPGEYESDDPDLFGLAAYLVENGHARFITGTDDDEAVSGYEAMTIAQLKAVAIERGLDVNKQYKKAELIALLESGDTGKAAGDGGDAGRQPNEGAVKDAGNGNNT